MQPFNTRIQVILAACVLAVGVGLALNYWSAKPLNNEVSRVTDPNAVAEGADEAIVPNTAGVAIGKYDCAMR